MFKFLISERYFSKYVWKTNDSAKRASREYFLPKVGGLRQVNQRSQETLQAGDGFSEEPLWKEWIAIDWELRQAKEKALSTQKQAHSR